MIEKPLHHCSEMEQLTQQPVFLAQEAVDRDTGEDVLIATLVMQTGFVSNRIHMKFCPWCGAILLPGQHPRGKYQRELAEYREYRKRYVKTEQHKQQLGFA